MDYLKAGSDQKVAGVLHKLKAVGVRPAGIGVREVLADVAERCRAQQGVRDGVRQNVGVGVAVKARLRGYPNPAEDQRPPWGQTMHVPADAAPTVTRIGLPVMSAEPAGRAL